MNYHDLCIEENLKIRQAMTIMDNTAQKILFVVDDNNKLLAALTDGDVRRFLLKGGSLDDRVIEAANKTPKYADNAVKAVELYHKKNYIAIPIVDVQECIVDIYFGGKIKKTDIKLNVPVVINAGGRGTRLDPFTKVLPKPLIPVGELPIIEHIMQRYEEFGCEQFHIIVNYKKQLMKSYFAESENRYDISWYDEEQPLGTGGGLSLLKGKLQETFFFTNCDILLQSNYDSMLRFHKTNGNAITMICAYKNLTIPYGVVEMGLNGCIEAMKEKPELSFLTNTGMYIVEPEVLEDIADGVSVGFPDIIEMQKEKGRKVAVYPVSENEWMDMGQFSELEKMRAKLYGE